MAQYIAAGFFTDAERLVNEFVQVNSMNFSSFSEIWKKRNFAAIYLGRDENEITQFTNEIYQITLGFLQTNSFHNQVGAVYLLYALYRNQICVPFIKIRITLPQFEIVKKIHIAARENQYRTLHYVIDYLFSNSFDFVATSTLYGPKASKCKVDYDSATYVSTLSRDVKSEITQFHDSRALQNLRDMNEKYSNLRQKVYAQETHQSTVNEYDKYVSRLEDLVVDKPMSCKHKATTSKAESTIGSRRAEIKAASFSKRAFFQRLNDSDDEEYVHDGKKPQPGKRRRRKHKVVPKEDKRLGRPKKFNLDELLMESEKSNENSASEMELPKKSDKRGAKKRMKFLEEENLVPTLSPIKFKKESTTSSDSENSNFEETDSQSS